LILTNTAFFIIVGLYWW